ncbi:hypothetical protein EOD39_12665 [Acipenser ruthenus]|uniref:Uncharacterized protein n=1 Tax=Acipenser ruthenus TaxID=7906 RepID=A0A662YQD6_ACIRT|nr:hypothetical protein EOD39_12665 [Acipenser ruthenus]
MDLTAKIRRPTEDEDAGKPERGKEGDRQKCVQRSFPASIPFCHSGVLLQVAQGETAPLLE